MRLPLRFNFSKTCLRSSAQSALQILAANMALTLGIHSRVVQRISGPGLLTLFFANLNNLRRFIAH
jgi:hypothetical protein